jgi:hypothetical protein
MAAMRSVTEVKLPRRMACRVMIEKKTSINGDEVQPRPRRRREVQGNPGVFRQPRLHVRVVVRAVVVAHDVQGHAGIGRRDVLEEGQELLVPVLGVAGAGHLAGRGLQRGEQRGGAVPDVVVAALFRGPGTQRQHRRFAFERLGLGLSSTHSTTALSGGFR